MELKELLKTVDHTQLAQAARWEDIRALCDEGVKYGVASVCIPACFVAQAAEYLQAEARFSIMIKDVFEILSDVINIKF